MQQQAPPVKCRRRQHNNPSLMSQQPRQSGAPASSSSAGSDAPAAFSFGPYTIPSSTVFAATALSFAFVNIRPFVRRASAPSLPASNTACMSPATSSSPPALNANSSLTCCQRR